MVKDKYELRIFQLQSSIYCLTTYITTKQGGFDRLKQNDLLEGRHKGLVSFKEEANLWLRGTHLFSFGWGGGTGQMTRKCAYRCPCWRMNMNNAFNIRSGCINCRVQSKASLVHSQVSASTINYISLNIDFNLGKKRISFINESRLTKIQLSSASTTEALNSYFSVLF